MNSLTVQVRFVPRRSRLASAVVELLMVFFIIGLLLTMFIPAISVARSASRKSQCLNNLKQHAVALQNYHDTAGSYPPGWSSDSLGRASWGWGPRLLPYAEQRMLAQSMIYEKPLASLANRGSIEHSINTYSCPADRKSWGGPLDLKLAGGKTLKLGISSFVASFGSMSFEGCDPMKPTAACQGNGVFFHDSFLRMAQLEDGASQTMMISERRADRLTAVWAGVAAGADDAIGRVVGHAGVTPNDDSSPFGFSSMHPRGVNVVFADGGVRFVPDKVDPQVFKALATIKGRELRIDF